MNPAKVREIVEEGLMSIPHVESEELFDAFVFLLRKVDTSQANPMQGVLTCFLDDSQYCGGHILLCHDCMRERALCDEHRRDEEFFADYKRYFIDPGEYIDLAELLRASKVFLEAIAEAPRGTTARDLVFDYLGNARDTLLSDAHEHLYNSEVVQYLGETRECPVCLAKLDETRLVCAECEPRLAVADM